MNVSSMKNVGAEKIKTEQGLKDNLKRKPRNDQNIFKSN